MTTASVPSWVGPVLAVALRRSVVERGGLVVTVGFHLLVTAALSGLWRLAAEANGGVVAGYSAVAVTWYLATTEACVVSINSRLIADIGQDISSGAVAVELARPVPVVWFRVVSEVGRTLPRLGACLAGGALLASSIGGPAPGPVALVLVPVSAVLAMGANVVAQHAFAAVAFWLRGAGSAWFLYHKLVFILGGMLIPLEALPDGLHRLSLLMPFAAMAYVPGRLAAGHLEPGLLALQLGWLVVLGFAAAAAFAAGERRLQVVGG